MNERNTQSTPEVAAGPTKSADILDKRSYGQRWGFSIRKVDSLIADGLPHLKVGARRVRIFANEADSWMRQQFGVQRRGAAR